MESSKYQQSTISTLILYSSPGVCRYDFCSSFHVYQSLFFFQYGIFNYWLSVHTPMIHTRNQTIGTFWLIGSHVHSKYWFINTINHSNVITRTDIYINLIIYSYTWGNTHPIGTYTPYTIRLVINQV